MQKIFDVRKISDTKNFRTVDFDFATLVGAIAKTMVFFVCVGYPQNDKQRVCDNAEVSKLQFKTNNFTIFVKIMNYFDIKIKRDMTFSGLKQTTIYKALVTKPLQDPKNSVLKRSLFYRISHICPY